MATIQFRLSSRTANGMSEVLVRFYDGTFSQRAKSHVYCPILSWSEKECMPVMPRRVNEDVTPIAEARRKLEQLREYVFSSWMQEKYDARDGWLQKTIDECFAIKPSNAPKTLHDVYEEYAIANNLDEATKRKYIVLLAALDRFYKNKPIYANEIRVHDIDAFCMFFRREKRKGQIINRSQNTITGKLKCWRALQNFAVVRGYAKSSPFAQFTIPAEVYGTPIFLTVEERDTLTNCEIQNHSLAVQRDIFIFQCHVGCRVSDLMSLTPNNVTPDGFLQYIPQKQRRSVPITVRVPLSRTAKEIVYKYAGGERLLPFIHPNNYNAAIHEVMKMAGLDRTVMLPNKLTMLPEYRPLYEVTTSHTARKTFIEAMFRETKSERITSAFTGHANGSRAFSRYTDVDDEMKREILNRLEHPKN